MLEWEWKITLDNLIAFAGLLFIGYQMRDGNKQQKMGSHIRLYAINRELIALGFSNPELFEILTDGKEINSTLARRYLQLWLNQLCLVDAFRRSGAFEKEVAESFETDLRDMLLLRNMRRHWNEFGKYYPASFQETVNAILHEAGYQQDATGGVGTKRSIPGARFFRILRGASSRSLRQ